MKNKLRNSNNDNWDNIEISLGFKNGKEIKLAPNRPTTLNIIRPTFKKDGDHDENEK